MTLSNWIWNEKIPIFSRVNLKSVLFVRPNEADDEALFRYSAYGDIVYVNKFDI